MNKSVIFLVQSVLFFVTAFLTVSFNDEFLSNILPFEGELALLIFELGLIVIGLHLLGEKMRGHTVSTELSKNTFNLRRVIKLSVITVLICLSPILLFLSIAYLSDFMTSQGFK